MTFDALGPWTWLILGILLCAAETFAPGMFLLWIGLAALATGLLLFIAPLTLAWTLMVFGLLTIVSVLLGRRFYGSRETDGDRPFLNRRADALIGSTFTLEEAIKDGAGRIRVHDSVWRVKGPDLPAGARVTVTGVEDSVLLTIKPA